MQRGGGILPRFTLDLRQDRATPECHDAVGILAIDSKITIISADIDIKGGMGNHFENTASIPIMGMAEPGHARRTDRPFDIYIARSPQGR